MSIEELKTIFKEQLSTIYEIKQLFINQFGEENVDLQSKKLKESRFILWYEDQIEDSINDGEEQPHVDPKDFFIGDFNFYVKWDKVKITNETGKSHLIRDLYAHIPVTVKGTLSAYKGFTLNRTTYTAAEWNSDYLHSHIQGILKTNPHKFQEPCLGQGPINASVNSLKHNFDKDWWEEFLFELDRYVYIESIAGVPWRKMKDIHASSTTTSSISLDTRYNSLRHLYFTSDNNLHSVLKGFIKYYVEHGNFEFNHSGNMFKHRLNEDEFWLRTSNAFIEYINTNSFPGITLDFLIAQNILIPAIIVNTRFLKVTSARSTAPVNTKILVFKGVVQRLKILQLEQEEENNNTIYLFNKPLTANLHNLLSMYMNYYYGRTTSTDYEY